MLVSHYKVVIEISITPDEEKTIISLHEQGISCTEISKRIGRYRSFAYDYLKKMGYDTRKSIYSKLTPEEVQAIRKRYQNGETAEKIRQDFSERIKAPETIAKIVKDGGIQMRPAKRSVQIDNIRFFEQIDTEPKAYILGLLLADGYIIEPRRKDEACQWGISLKESDKYILEYIMQTIGIENKKICHYNHLFSLCVTSQIMVDDLAKYSIVPRKSFIVQFPTELTPQEMHRHIIRGYFDGNGCVSRPNCTFYGNDSIVTSIRDILESEAEMSHRKVYYNNTCHVHSISFSRKSDLAAFRDYIYSDATVWMKRKRDKFELLASD